MKPLSVMWLGLRGFPGVQGGVETHAEHLCPLLAQLGCEVTVIVRSRYQAAAHGAAWRGVRFVPLWSPRSSSLEAIVHTLAGVAYAAVKRPDILHIQAIGPALMAPLARLLGLRVVVTHHGADYERQKWGKFARKVLRLGERCGMACAHARIVISRHIHESVRCAYGKDSVIIPNGVALPEPDAPTDTLSETLSDTLRRFDLHPRRYALLVARFVPEKRHHDLIRAFQAAALPGWKLVLVGGADHPDAYSQSVLDAASRHANVVCAGIQRGKALSDLYAHAGVFALPSSHEGLPIAMLEAISHGIPVIASDIPANREVQSAFVCHYPLGDIDALAHCLTQAAQSGVSDELRMSCRELIRARYHWPDLAQRTMRVYASVCAGAPDAKKANAGPGPHVAE